MNTFRSNEEISICDEALTGILFSCLGFGLISLLIALDGAFTKLFSSNTSLENINSLVGIGAIAIVLSRLWSDAIQNAHNDYISGPIEMLLENIFIAFGLLSIRGLSLIESLLLSQVTFIFFIELPLLSIITTLSIKPIRIFVDEIDYRISRGSSRIFAWFQLLVYLPAIKIITLLISFYLLSFIFPLSELADSTWTVKLQFFCWLMIMKNLLSNILISLSNRRLPKLWASPVELFVLFILVIMPLSLLDKVWWRELLLFAALGINFISIFLLTLERARGKTL